MKVRVVLTVEVDVKRWRDEYGNPDLTADEIREDVRGSIAQAAATDGVVAPRGLITDVTVRHDD